MSKDPKDLKRPEDYMRIRFRASELEALLTERGRQHLVGSANLAAKRDLGRYYTLLEASQPALTPPEACLLCDIMNGTVFNPIKVAMHMLHASLEDCEEAYFQKWGVEREGFIARAEAWTPAESVAIIDAVERFWAAAPGSDENTEALAARIFLT